MSSGDLPRPERPLTDGVVALRPWRQDDLPAVVRMCQDPEIARFTRVPSPYTEEDARTYLERHEEQEVGFAIVEAEDDNDVLGSIGLRDNNAASQRTAEKAGFRREGVLRSYMLIKGERHDAVIFGITPEDLA
jgi:RimJ/RimL family protein N-acetyltransferase